MNESAPIPGNHDRSQKLNELLRLQSLQIAFEVSEETLRETMVEMGETEVIEEKINTTPRPKGGPTAEKIRKQIDDLLQELKS